MPERDYKELLKYFLGIALLTAINFIGGKTVSLFAYVDQDIALLWPPTAISFAFLLRFGSKWWPGVFLGEFLFHYSRGQSFLPASTTGLGDILGILISLYYLRKAGFSNRFTRQKDVLYFVLFALTLCPIVDASIGATARLLTGIIPPPRYALVWISWVIGDVTALIVLFPVFATFPKKKEIARWPQNRVMEAILLITGISLVSFFVFFNPAESGSSQLPLVYLPMPFLIWAALSFGPFPTALAGLITSGMAVIGTAQRQGPFIQEDIFSTVAFLWAYLIVASILALLLAAIQAETQKARNKIRDSEARFKALSTASFEAIFVTIDGIIIDFNEAAVELFGYDSEQFSNMTFVNLLATDAVPIVKEYMISGLPTPFELKAVRKDGTLFFAEFRSRLYQYEAYSVIIIAVRDITPLKKAIEKERDLNEALALREEELRQQLLFVEKMNEELDRANKALDRFVYSASHDLRAPISSSLGLINIARMEKDRNEMINYLNLQEKSLKRLDHFISDILDFSKNSRTEILKEEIAFEVLLQEIFHGYDFLENSERISKITEIDQQKPFFSDKRRISIILNNLISNAIRYQNPFANDPFVKVQVETNACAAVIRVIDNGIGIDTKHVDKVFDMFYRASTSQVGSGLGLYIVKEILDKLKGTIVLESEANIGSCFILTIPNLH